MIVDHMGVYRLKTGYERRVGPEIHGRGLQTEVGDPDVYRQILRGFGGVSK